MLSSKERDQKAARILHNQGIEMMPDEIAECRKVVLAKTRKKLKEKGYKVPDNDHELLSMIFSDMSEKDMLNFIYGIR